MPVKAEAVVEQGWWTHGDLEAGGRFFLNNPQKDGLASNGQNALGKFYEYRDLRPGPFGNAWLATGSKNGKYQFDFWADDIGRRDQRFEVNGSRAGEFYINGVWDQTPHIYSTNAQTLYNGVGTNRLTLPAGLSNTLFGAAGCTNGGAGVQPGGCTSGSLGTTTGFGGVNPSAAGLAVQAALTNNLYTTEIGIRRDTAAAGFRWTPTDAWDINFDYSHMRRHGTQVEGVVFSPGTSGVVAQVPKPVDDTTQNFGVNGEYTGTSPWGQLFTFKLGYGGSLYRDEWNSYTVDNPFCPTGAGPGQCARNGSPSSPTALMSLWPDNSSHGFNSTIGANLPMKSRYMGTLQYTMMRQNQAFLPFTNQPQVFTVGNTTLGAVPTLPASSLNGAINTFLSNNVVTTQLTPDLKSKLSYRYYDFANNTPELLFNDWVVTDVKTASTTSASYAPVRSLSISYNKQNAGAELVWSAMRNWNIGADYGYERYKWTRADADVTHQNSGRLFTDYKPRSWLTLRGSYLVSDRHYDTYDYKGFVGNYQWAAAGCQPAAGCNTQYSQAMRQFYLDNRQRQQGRFAAAINVIRGLTVTPTFTYQDDSYSISATEAGLTRSQSIKSGVEAAYVFNPWTNVLVAYMHERYRQNLKFTTGQTLTAANTYHSDIKDNVNTFMAAFNWGAIPQKLDFRFSYTVSLFNNSQPLNRDDNAVIPTVATGGQFPDVKGQWSRFEAQAKYTFDRDSVRALGINAEAYAKLRYVWERNSVNNLDQDIMQPYMNALVSGTGFMTWMAFDNPNYNVHLLGASVGLRW